jgi:integrase/recombinase XerC/integrase/recombinase XerD
VRFSDRSIQALEEYLHARSALNLSFPHHLESEPLFARHDIRASKILRPITPGGMWKAIKDRIVEAGVKRSMVRIHDFRHFFVTTTYLASQDLKLSQELARHKSIQVTQRYAHLSNDELDQAYFEIFEKNHNKPNDS